MSPAGTCGAPLSMDPERKHVRTAAPDRRHGSPVVLSRDMEANHPEKKSPAEGLAKAQAGNAMLTGLAGMSFVAKSIHLAGMSEWQ